MYVCGTPVGHGDFEMYPAAVPYLIGHLQRTMRRNLLLYIACLLYTSSLVESFNLIELKLDRGFAAEHGNGYVYLVLIRLNRRYNACLLYTSKTDVFSFCIVFSPLSVRIFTII